MSAHPEPPPEYRCRKCNGTLDISTGDVRLDYARSANYTVYRVYCPSCGTENFFYLRDEDAE